MRERKSSAGTLFKIAALVCAFAGSSGVSHAQSSPAAEYTSGQACDSGIKPTSAQFDRAYKHARRLYLSRCGTASGCNAPEVTAAYQEASCLFNGLANPGAQSAYLRGVLEEHAHEFARAEASYQQCYADPGIEVATRHRCLSRAVLLACALPENATACMGGPTGSSPTLAADNGGRVEAGGGGEVDSAISTDVAASLRVTISRRGGGGLAPTSPAKQVSATATAPAPGDVHSLRQDMTSEETAKLRAAAKDITIEPPH